MKLHVTELLSMHPKYTVPWVERYVRSTVSALYHNWVTSVFPASNEVRGRCCDLLFA